MLRIDDIPQQVADDMQRQAVDLLPEILYNAFERSGLYGKKLLVDKCGTACN